MEQNYYNETPVQTPVQNTATPAAVEQAVNDAFGKCLAAAIMCQFPVASIIAIFFGFQGLNMLENAKAMAANAGVSAGGKAVAAKILGMVGKIGGIVVTACYAFSIIMGMFSAILSML